MAAEIATAITPELVSLDVPPPADRKELFARMIAQLLAAGRITDPGEFLSALEEREGLGSTYMGNDLALPHGRSSAVIAPSVVFWRLASPMEYESAGESGPVTRAVMLAVPEGAASEHLRVLALLARLLLDEPSVAALEAATRPDEVVDVVRRFADSHG